MASVLSLGFQMSQVVRVAKRTQSVEVLHLWVGDVWSRVLLGLGDGWRDIIMVVRF